MSVKIQFKPALKLALATYDEVELIDLVPTLPCSIAETAQGVLESDGPVERLTATFSVVEEVVSHFVDISVNLLFHSLARPANDLEVWVGQMLVK